MPVNFQEVYPCIEFDHPRMPVVVAADRGAPIGEVNRGLAEFGTALEKDFMARNRAEVCVISFGTDIRTELDFRPAAEYAAPTLEADGASALNGAIGAALDIIEERRKFYKCRGISWYRPLLVVLSGGGASDPGRASDAISRLRAAIECKKVSYMPVAIGTHANREMLQAYYPDAAGSKPVLEINEEYFREVFCCLGDTDPYNLEERFLHDDDSLPVLPENIIIPLDL